MTFALENTVGPHAAGFTAPRASPITGTFHAGVVERVIDVMTSDIEACHSTTELARSAGLSRFHFIRVFQEVSGVSPIRFLYAKRIQVALHRIITTDESILQICLQSGYNSHGTFTRRFVELVGASPSQIRTMHRRVQSSSIDVRTLLDRASTLPRPAEKGCVRGRVVGADSHGLCVVGAFPLAVSAGPPVACTIADRSGLFSMLPPLSLPSYHLLAITLRVTDTITNFILQSPMQVGKSGPFHAGERPGSEDWLIRIRSSSTVDPPLLFPVGLYMLANLLEHTSKMTGV